MKQLFLISIFLWSISFQGNAQLVVSSVEGKTPQQFLEQMYFGEDFKVSNVTFNGSSLPITGTQIGHFNGEQTNVGLDNGILLTSGSIFNAVGPNQSGSSTAVLNLPGDDLLTQLANGGLYPSRDAAVIEFDFTLNADQFNFEYVFGSEEYLGYSGEGSTINDIFGFFISGPKPGGGFYDNTNLAIIPGTDLPVAIKNITTINGICKNCQYYVDNGYEESNFPYSTDITRLNYDGMTTVLSAQVYVVPKKTYHFKIAISDIADGAWDSGVLLHKITSPVLKIQVEDVVLCNGEQAILEPTTMGGSKNYTSYQWSPSTGLNTTNGKTVIASPTVTTTYIVTVTDDLDDTATDAVVVSINPGPMINSVVIVPDSTCITGNNGGVSVSASQIVDAGAASFSGVYTFNGGTTGAETSATDVTFSPFQFAGLGGGMEYDRASFTNWDATTTWDATEYLEFKVDADNDKQLKFTSTDSISFSYLARSNTPTDELRVSYSVDGGPFLPLSTQPIIYPTTCGSYVTTLDNSPVASSAFSLGSLTGCINQDEPITITYNDQEGEKLGNLSNLSTIYIHTGTIPPEGWDNATAWGQNEAKYLTIQDPLDVHKHTLTMAPTLKKYYNTSTDVQGVAMLFRGDTYLNGDFEHQTFDFDANFSSTGYSTQWMKTSLNGIGTLKGGNIRIRVQGKNLQYPDGAKLYIDDVKIKGTTVQSQLTYNIGTGEQNEGVFTKLNAGNYTVTVTDFFGCQTKVKTMIPSTTCDTINSTFTFNNGCKDSPVSFTDYTTSFYPILGYKWDFGDGQTSSEQHPTHTYTTAGTYDVKQVVWSQTKIDSTTQSIVIFDTPIVFAGADMTICAGTDTLIKGATGVGAYLWSHSLGTAVSPAINPVSSTTYMLTITNSDGCSHSDDIMVTVNALPIVSAGSDVTICPKASATLLATGSGNYIWSTGAITTQITVSPTVNSTYTVTTSNGICSASDKVIVTISDIGNPFILGDTTLCPGQTTTLKAMGGTSYSWTPSGQTTQEITLSHGITTTYTVQISDDYGCTGSTSRVVVSGTAPTEKLPSSFSICEDDSIYLLPPTNTYFYSVGQLIDSVLIKGKTTPSPYKYLLTNSSFCVVQGQIDLLIGQPIDAHVTPDTTICSGDSLVLKVIGADTYQWHTAPNDTLDSLLVFPIQPSTYMVTSEKAGCKDIDTIQVAIQTLTPVEITGDAIICKGDSTTLQVSTGTTYSWSTGDKTIQAPNLKPLLTTLYSVTITDDIGCSNTDTIEVQVLPQPSISLPKDTLLCAGSELNISATGGASYLWLDNSTDDFISFTLAQDTSIIVKGFDLLGCSNTDTMNINVSATFNAIATSDTAVCLGESVKIAIAGGDTYEWNTTPIQIKDTILVSPTLSTTYLVTTTKAGCKDIDTIKVAIKQAPVYAILGDASICKEESTELSVNTGTSFSWNTGASTSSILVSPVLTSTYTITTTFDNGCKRVVEQEVKVNPVPSVEAGADRTICKEEETTLSAIGTGLFSWSNGLGEGNHFNVSPLISTTYRVTATLGSCTAMDSLSVQVNPLPEIEITANDTVCFDQPFDVLATSGMVSYLWNVNKNTPSFSLQLKKSKWLYVTFTDTNGCDNIDSSFVFVTPTLTFNTEESIEICEEIDTSLTIFTNGISYLWSTGENTQTIFIQPTENTLYTVTVTDELSCTGSIDVQVIVNEKPVALFYPDTLFIKAGEEVFFQDASYSVSPIASWEWRFGIHEGMFMTKNPSFSSPTYTYDSEGTYTVNLLVTNKKGCANTYKQTISVSNWEKVYLVDAFSPNGDGYNDRFKPRGNFISLEMKVYNQWGLLLFATNDINTEGWDGTRKGVEQPIGNYTYTIVAKTIDQKIRYKDGVLTLFR